MILRLTCSTCGDHFWQRYEPCVYIKGFPVPNHPRGLCRSCVTSLLEVS